MLSAEQLDLDEHLGFRGLPRAVIVFVVVLTIVFGVVVRFVTSSALWLDEALTVDIARLPLHEIPAFLKRDGSPPAYYFLLHFWMGIFGDSDLAVRSLSGLLSIVTLPVAWLAAKRMGGRVLAWTTVVLLASSPFGTYYATEARMYSLVILLTACGVLALHRTFESSNVGNLTAVTAVTAGLLYSQYWSLYLVGCVGIWLLVLIWLNRNDHEASPVRSTPAFRALVAVLIGGLTFVPWLSTFLYQSRHTGTPWSVPANFSAVITAITGFTDNQASLDNVVTNQGRLLALIYVVMAALALFGVARTRSIIDLDIRTTTRARGLTGVIVGTLFAAVAGGLLSGSAFSSRYAAVVFFPVILLVAIGTTTLLGTRVRVGMLAVAVAAGIILCVQNISTQRTQAPKVATVLNAEAKPGDVIAFCPDQLGPSVSRLIDSGQRYRMVTFPRGIGPQFVDWVNYLHAVDIGNSAVFTKSLIRQATGSHHIWLVWQVGYQGYGVKCAQIADDLLANSHLAIRNWVISSPKTYYEPMTLTEFAPAS